MFTPTKQPHANCHNGWQWTFSPAAQVEYSRAESRRFVPKMETGASGIYDCHGKNPKNERNAGGNHSELRWTRIHKCIYDHLEWSNEGDKDRPDKLLEKLEEYCAPKGNVVVNAYRFWNARWKEPFDAYLTELQTMAALCDHDDVDRMIRDKIVFSASVTLNELLLRDTNLTLSYRHMPSFQNDAPAGERNEPGIND